MKYFLSIVFFFTFYAIPSPTLACSCGVGGYWVSEYVENKSVFKGRVLQTTWLGEARPGQRRFENAETKFLVTTPYTKIGANEVRVKHHTDSAACGVHYRMGYSTLVIAYGNNADDLKTGSCLSWGVPEITLIEYFEENKNPYIPSVRSVQMSNLMTLMTQRIVTFGEKRLRMNAEKK